MGSEMCIRDRSEGQQAAMTTIHDGVRCADANALQSSNRFIYLSGEPGSGKSEVLAHSAVDAAKDGYSVLVPCPTGTLVHSCRKRFPDTDHIAVETIHSGYAIYRGADQS